MKAESVREFLRPYARPNRKTFVACYIMLFFGIILTIILPQILRLVIDYIIDPSASAGINIFSQLFRFLTNYNSVTVFWILISAFLVMVIIKNLLYYFRKRKFQAASIKTFVKVRSEVIKKLANLDRLDDEGDLFLNLTYGVSHISTLYQSIYPDIFENVFLALFSVAFIFMFNYVIGIVVVLTIPLFVLIQVLYAKASAKVYEKTREEEEKINALSEEYIGGIKDIRQLGFEDYAISKFQNACDDEFVARREVNKYVNKYDLILKLLHAFVYAGVIILAGVLALKEVISIGSFVAVVSYAFTVFSSLIASVSVTFKTQETYVNVKKIQKLLNRKSKIVNFKSKEIINSEPNIRFEKLAFNSGEESVLKNITLDIPYGTTIGITGTQGSGKSVLGKLLLRIIQPTRGGISVNETDIKEININSLRSQFSYQPQDPHIFNDTIKGNIVLFDKNVDEKRLNQVISLVRLNKYIKSNKNGINEILFEDGAGVPKQEKQKINIARALYRNAPVLLLDSPIKYFDSADSEEILKNIFLHYYGKSIIILSSNPEELMLCDNVVFIKDGKIAEEGSPEQLIELGGHFAKAYFKAREWSGK